MSGDKLFVLRNNDPNHALDDIALDVGEIFLGRGPVLKITDTGISRKHVRVNIRKPDDADDASFLLTCIHKSGVLIRKSGTDLWRELQVNYLKKNMYKYECGSDVLSVAGR